MQDRNTVGVELSADEMKKKYPDAWKSISARQRTYIDEFRFFMTCDWPLHIEAHYGGTIIATWVESRWK